MAHIRRRRLRDGTARWQARTSSGSRKGRSELARDFERKGDAEAWLRDQGALIEQKGVSGGRVSVAAFISRWLSFLEQQGRLAPRTLTEYRKHAARVVALVGNVRLDRLTPLHLDQCYVQLRQHGGYGGKPLSPRTVLHCHRIIHAALARGVRWRLLPMNPASEAEAPSAGRSPAKAPATEELRAYLQAAE